MKVYFHHGYKYSWMPTILSGESNMLALSFNNWDDFGISTTLNAVLYLNGDNFLEFSLKLLIENDDYSPKKLNELREAGWDGYFPIPNLNYISIPSDIDFYSALLGVIGDSETRKVLELIRDGGYLEKIKDDALAKELIKNERFNKSLLRESGSRKAYEDGWNFFVQTTSSIKDFTLFIRRYDGSTEPINFKFNSEILPYDINVLIGPNGIGKSYTLKSLVEYWLGIESGSQEVLERIKHTPFDHSPNISKLILISYSPFEEFTLDLSGAKLLDKDAYKYFGFRQLSKNEDGSNIKNEDGTYRTGISRNLPSSDSVASILKAFADDRKFGFMKNWKNKIATIRSVLEPAIGFENIAVEIQTPIDINVHPILPFRIIQADDDKMYLPLDESTFNFLDSSNVDSKKLINFQSGVVFLERNNRKINLSSGQRLFCYIVVNVVGQIRSDSLVVIDEPELFLHPTLEIEFISLLKKVLEAFNSKAILATHSLAIAREVPAKCMHVYRKHENTMEIDHPPFETFGGDMQRISTYVFGDKAISKPFDQWLYNKLVELQYPDELIKKLGTEINEELLIKIRNWRGN